MPKRHGEQRGERHLLQRLQREILPPEQSGAGVPFGDDMASLDAEGRWLWSCDMLCDGVDFRSQEHGWYAIGRKAAAIALSDCAAMASRPRVMLCSVCLQEALPTQAALDLLRGVHETATGFGCRLVGGDTNGWQHPAAIDVVVASEVPSGRRPVLRSGARPGDQICVTGPLGGSLLGRHMTFTPRIDLALRLADVLQPHAMIDISDGLALDLWRICEASGCGAELNEAALNAVIHPDAQRMAAQTGRSPLEHALYDGEDFELIVVADPARLRRATGDLGLRAIGRMVEMRSLTLRDTQGGARPLEIRGWEHLR